MSDLIKCYHCKGLGCFDFAEDMDGCSASYDCRHCDGDGELDPANLTPSEYIRAALKVYEPQINIVVTLTHFKLSYRQSVVTLQREKVLLNQEEESTCRIGK
jgi:hypothetical protein